jgi:hypothetical protein
MNWWRKLALDAVVAAVVWAAGVWVFHAAGEWESREFLVWVPLGPVWLIWAVGELGGWGWVGGLCVLPVVFAGQFIGRRGWGWTVAGALAVAIWFAVGVWVAVAMAGAASC